MCSFVQLLIRLLCHVFRYYSCRVRVEIFRSDPFAPTMIGVFLFQVRLMLGRRKDDVRFCIADPLRSPSRVIHQIGCVVLNERRIRVIRGISSRPRLFGIHLRAKTIFIVFDGLTADDGGYFVGYTERRVNNPLCVIEDLLHHVEGDNDIGHDGPLV